MGKKSKLALASGFTTFLFKMVVAGMFISIIGLLLGRIGLFVVLGIYVIFYYYMKTRTVKKAMKQQLKFMKSKRRVRTVNMVVGRWGDFIYVNCFGINFAADYDDPEEIRNMIKDIAIFTKTLRKTGKMPKGKLYSEMSAYYVKNLGLSNDDIKHKCYTDVLSVIDYLFRLQFTREPNMMVDWINAISIELRNQGRTVYHRSFIIRVINDLEKLSADLQVDARKAGGSTPVVG